MRRAALRGEPFELVLTDVHMPEMDGFDLVKKIKDSPSLTGAVILMLTSGEHRGDLARCKELGVSAYLTKPVRRAELRSAISKAIVSQSTQDVPSRSVLEVARERPSKKHTGPGAHILLVEDNVINQRVGRGILERAGHSVVIADTGKQALRLLDEQSFDIILMDLQMPELDGFETTAVIRESENGTGIRQRIIAMTAHALTGDRERCLRADLDDYITKPVDAPALLKLIHQYSDIGSDRPVLST
jgi:CheY-like chemotaxis protein